MAASFAAAIRTLACKLTLGNGTAAGASGSGRDCGISFQRDSQMGDPADNRSRAAWAPIAHRAWPCKV